MMPTDASVRRHLKRNFLKENHNYFAICEPGLEQILAWEIANLPQTHSIQNVSGGVLFSGPLLAVYSAHLHLRTAGRVLLRIAEFYANSYPELFNKLQNIPFEWHSASAGTPVIKASSVSSRLHHTGEIARVTKDALIKRTGGAVPESALYVRFEKDICMISLDLSGEHLSRRGYKTWTSEAPLRETSAAALILYHRIHTLIRKAPVTYDPFCGSGTFLFESFLTDFGIPPGLFRNFSFEKTPWFTPGLLERSRESFTEIVQKRVKTETRHYLAQDSDPGVSEVFEGNLKNLSRLCGAETENNFHFRTADSMKDFHPSSGLILTNPPYGVRIGSGSDLKKILKKLSADAGSSDSDIMILMPAEQQSYRKEHGLEQGLRFRNGGIPVITLQRFRNHRV